MGPCIDGLKGAGADEKTVAVLDQIRSLHRNPLMHPEVFLTADEGLRLFDIAKSAISAMADQIKQLSVGTTSQPALQPTHLATLLGAAAAATRKP